jgi:hypothetical protein
MQYYILKENLHSLMKKKGYTEESFYDKLKWEHADCLTLIRQGGPTRDLCLIGAISHLLDAMIFQFAKSKHEPVNQRDIQAVVALQHAPLDYDIRHFDG